MPIAQHRPPRSRAAMDQDRLSLLQVAVGEDSLPCGLGCHRHRCRLFKGELVGFRAMAAALTATYSAYAPIPLVVPKTASPGDHCATSLLTRSTTPENS